MFQVNSISGRLVIIFSALAAMALQLHAQSLFQFPQVVVGQKGNLFFFTTKISLISTGAVPCEVAINYILAGDQAPGISLFTNGVDRGDSFLETVPANGTLALKITEAGQNLIAFAASIDPTDPSCRDVLNGQAEYTISSLDGKIVEVFSYQAPPFVPLGSCSVMPVEFDPDTSDGRTTVPGIASIGNPAGQSLPTLLCISLQESNGNRIAGPKCSLFDGTKRANLLNDPDLFPDQTGFSGGIELCTTILGLGVKTVNWVNHLGIGVVQSGKNVQYSTLVQGVKNPNCIPGNTTLCLYQNRFRVRVNWNDGSNSGQGQAMEIDDRSGFFYFLDPENTDLLVQVLNGCVSNNHYWVYVTAATYLEYTLTVTDTESGQTRTYENPLGTTPDPIQNTTAFATCP